MKIDVYPVGVLAGLLWARRAARRGLWRVAWDHLRSELRYVVQQAQARRWRAVRNALNGYLAEPIPAPEGLRRCGHGWTRRRAMRSLRRELAATVPQGEDGQ